MKKLNALIALLLAGAMTLGVGLTGCAKKGGGSGDSGNGSHDTGNGSDDNGNGSDDNGNGSDDNGNGSDDNGNGSDDNGNGSDDNGNGSGDNGNGTDDNGNGSDDNGNGSDDNGNGSDDNQTVTETITLNIYKLSLIKGGKATLKATVTSDGATDKSVTWGSSDPNVATVSGGEVTAVANGTAEITATSASGKTAKCQVIVSKTASAEIVEVESVTLSHSNAELEVDEILTMSATVNPVGADETLIWSSSNTGVATVSDGVVTAKSAGKCTVTATAANGKKATCNIQVYAAPVIAQEFTYSAANKESAAFEWSDSRASNATVEYKISGTADSTFVQVDPLLIRQIEPTKARVDVLGLQGGKSYDFRVTPSSGTVLTAANVTVKSYDRSGYAHFNYTSGVGAYNDDGTLKDNALVIYVSEENKNDITNYCYVNGVKTDISQYLWKKNGVTQTSIGYLLNNRAYSSNAERENYGIQKLATVYSGVAVRILDEVTATRDDKGYYSIDGLTNYAKSGEINPETGEQYKKGVSVPNGGTVGDNGGMVRIINAKNLTIEGVGEEAMIHGWGIHFISNDNLHKYAGSGKSFEVRNVTFFEYPEDAIGMEGTQGLKVDANGSITSGDGSDAAEIISSVERCWIHNNTFLPGHCVNPAESDKAEGDGSCDFKRGQYFTCSYNWFEYCHKTNLVGSADASQQYNLTYHHNVWYQCGSRIPLTRQANVHFYNNYVWGDTTEKTTPYDWIPKPAPSYIHSLRATCYIFSEGNYYDGCKNVVDGTGGVAKGWKNLYFSCYGGSTVTEADSRVQKVDNNCYYKFGKIDYSAFDTDPALFYYDAVNKKSDCYLTDAVTARVECLVYAGVLKHTYDKSGYYMTTERPDSAVTVGSEGLTVDLSKATLGGTISGVKFINAKNNSGAAKGKGLLAVFTLTERTDITLSGGTTGDAAIELLNVNGTVIANKIISFTGTLEAGTYMITAGQKEKDGSITALSFKCGITDSERVQNVIDYIDGIGEIELTAECAEKIQFAQSAYNALSANLKVQVTNSGVLAVAVNNYNALAAAKVIDLIDSIGKVNADSGVKISEAMTAYGSLTASQQALVTNYQTLVKAQQDYSQFEVQGVQNAIEKLAAASSATSEEEVRELLEQYLTVKNMYEDLDEDKKPEVTGYDKVTDGIKSLQGALKVYDTIELIDALPAAGSVTAADSAKIKEARAAYNSLDTAQKAGVTNLARLTAAEDALKELIGEVVVVIFADSDSLAAGGVSLTGSKKNYKDMTFEYDGKTYDKALKMEDKTEITIVLTEKSTVTIKLSASGKAINYDGKNKASSGSDGTVTLTLEAGTHTITKNNPTEVLYIEIVAA